MFYYLFIFVDVNSGYKVTLKDSRSWKGLFFLLYQHCSYPTPALILCSPLKGETTFLQLKSPPSAYRERCCDVPTRRVRILYSSPPLPSSAVPLSLAPPDAAGCPRGRPGPGFGHPAAAPQRRLRDRSRRVSGARRWRGQGDAAAPALRPPHPQQPPPSGACAGSSWPRGCRWGRLGYVSGARLRREGLGRMEVGGCLRTGINASAERRSRLGCWGHEEHCGVQGRGAAAGSPRRWYPQTLSGWRDAEGRG